MVATSSRLHHLCREPQRSDSSRKWTGAIPVRARHLAERRWNGLAAGCFAIRADLPGVAGLHSGRRLLARMGNCPRLRPEMMTFLEDRRTADEWVEGIRDGTIDRGLRPERLTLEEAKRSAGEWIEGIRSGAAEIPQTLLINIAVFPDFVSPRAKRFYHQATPIRLPLAVVLPS